MQKHLRDERWPDCPWVFFRRGKPIHSIRGAWDAACAATGLVDANGDTLRVFHDLRRTGVRNLVRAGVPERVAMAISGHKTRSVFDRYNIVSERDLHEAAESLNRYIHESFSEPSSERDGDSLGTVTFEPASGAPNNKSSKLLN